MDGWMMGHCLIPRTALQCVKEVHFHSVDSEDLDRKAELKAGGNRVLKALAKNLGPSSAWAGKHFFSTVWI